MIEINDEVVHQSHPGRFTVTAIEPRPSLNVNGRVLTIRSRDGVELRILDTAVRAIPKAPSSETPEKD